MVLRILLSAIACAGLGCAPAAVEQGSLRIACASSLRFVAEELEASFEASHPKTQLEITYGASGAFYAQLGSGAPFDVFLSADLGYPKNLARQDLTAGEPFHYASGRLVAWTRDQRLESLTDEAIERIAIANPRLAPYGRAAKEALRFLDVETRDRVVLGDSVAQALQFAQTGAADVAIVAESLLHAPGLRGQGRTIPLPTESYRPIEHAGVILRSARDMQAARALRRFLTSPDAQAILSQYGFGPPES